MAAKKDSNKKVKGPIITTEKGGALFVSVPNASQYDTNKQEATILLGADEADKLKAQLQDFLDSTEVKESGIKDTGFVEKAFKDDTDADGNSTGLVRFKAKTSMIYPCKTYSADGTAFQPDPGFKVPNRATIRMSFRPEVMESSVFTGLVFRLQAIKILDMPSFDDGLSGAEEGSFSVPSGMSAPEDGSFDSSSNGWD